MEKKTFDMENQEDVSSVIETQLSAIDVINMMLTFWWLIVVMAVLVGGSTYAYSKITAVPEYNSVGTLYINTQTEQKSEDVNASALNNAKVLMPTYIEILNSKPFLELVGEDLNDKYSYDEIKNFITLEAIEDTNLINIKVNTTDAHDSYLICTSIVNNAVDEIIRVFEGGSVKLINSPEESLYPTPSFAYKKGITGALIGAVVAMLIIFLINLFDTRVKSSEELKNKYNLPILGEVSNLRTM